MIFACAQWGRAHEFKACTDWWEGAQWAHEFKACTDWWDEGAIGARLIVRYFLQQIPAPLPSCECASKSLPSEKALPQCRFDVCPDATWPQLPSCILIELESLKPRSLSLHSSIGANMRHGLCHPICIPSGHARMSITVPCHVCSCTCDLLYEYVSVCMCVQMHVRVHACVCACMGPTYAGPYLCAPIFFPGPCCAKPARLSCTVRARPGSACFAGVASLCTGRHPHAPPWQRLSLSTLRATSECAVATSEFAVATSERAVASCECAVACSATCYSPPLEVWQGTRLPVPYPCTCF